MQRIYYVFVNLFTNIQLNLINVCKIVVFPEWLLRDTRCTVPSIYVSDKQWWRHSPDGDCARQFRTNLPEHIQHCKFILL